MKALALLLGAFLVLGGVGAAIAQSPTPAPSAPAQSETPKADTPKAETPKADVDVKADVKSEAPKGPDININVKKDEGRQDGGSAFPRGGGGERTTIFGLSPTAAVVIAAALLVVVILAIVAMTRSGDSSTTYVDRERRM